MDNFDETFRMENSMEISMAMIKAVETSYLTFEKDCFQISKINII